MKNQKAIQKANTAGTQLMSLPSVPQSLAGKLSAVDYGICKLQSGQSIGQLIRQPEFDLNCFLNKLGGIFMQAIGDLGIKTLPDKAAEKRMIYYVANYYKDLSPDEIRKAFELGIVGELQVDIEHYHSFDIKYICKILNAYRLRRKAAQKNLDRVRPREEKTVSGNEKKQIRKAFLESLCRDFETFCKTGKINLVSCSYVFDVLTKMELIRLSKSDKRRIKNKAKRRYQQNSGLGNSKAPFQLDKNTESNLCREIAVMEFFQKCRNDNINFRELLFPEGAKSTKSGSKQTKKDK